MIGTDMAVHPILIYYISLSLSQSSEMKVHLVFLMTVISEKTFDNLWKDAAKITHC